MESWPKRVFYDTSVSPAELVTNSALLLTSRQICAETRYVLDHLRRTKQLHYALDIMFVNEDSVWPTWLGMPALATHIDSLTATIRICGPAGNMKYWRGGDGCGPFNVWVYYALMERFFRCGAPSFNTRVAHRDLDRGVTVGALVIDVISPTADETKLWPKGRHEWSTWQNGQRSTADGVVRSENQTATATTGPGTRIPIRIDHYSCGRNGWSVFYSAISRGLVNMGYHSAAYGGFLMERVGTVQFRHDGQTVSTLELAKSLAEMRFTHSQDTFGHVYPNENRVPEFWRWKKRALKKRQAAGVTCDLARGSRAGINRR